MEVNGAYLSDILPVPGQFLLSDHIAKLFRTEPSEPITPHPTHEDVLPSLGSAVPTNILATEAEMEATPATRREWASGGPVSEIGGFLTGSPRLVLCPVRAVYRERITAVMWGFGDEVRSSTGVRGSRV